MIRRLLIAAMMAVGSTAAFAETLLIVDLNTTNQITITATDGLSGANESGSDFIGVYLANFYASSGPGLDDSLVSGDLTNALNATDNTPDLFRSNGDSGLNIFSFSSDDIVEFETFFLAFTGSATWTVGAEVYADLLDNTSSGNIFFPADTEDDVVSANLVGRWEVADATVVPVPAPFFLLVSALLGLGGLMARSRRQVLFGVAGSAST